MSSVRCVSLTHRCDLPAQLTPPRSYLWNSREIEWSCPGGTQPAYLWQEFKPTELDKITGKLTGGPGCMASVTFKGKESRAAYECTERHGLNPVTTLRDGGTIRRRSRAAGRYLRLQLYVGFSSP